MEYGNYKIESGAFTYKVIKPKGKGSVPAQLRGMYTSIEEAKKAIDFYTEGDNNGKTRTTKRV